MNGNASDQHVYESLADSLAQLIVGETYRPGDRMPSVRQLRMDHRVSVTTVLGAYEQLENRGLVESRPRSGFYVKARFETDGHIPRRPTSVGKPMEVSQAGIYAAVMEAVSDPSVVPFGAAVPGDDVFPKAKLASLMNSVIRKHGASAFRYTISPGRPELRLQVARRLFKAGVKVIPDEVITTMGATESLLLALQATTQPGDIVAVEVPTFFGILKLVSELGLRVVEVPVRSAEGMDLDALENALKNHQIKACIVQPNFQNPVGCRMSDENKKRLVKLGHESRFALIEDDLYGDLFHSGTRPTALKAYDHDGEVIHCGGVSKSISPGLRVGWILPGRWMDRVRHLKSVQFPANATISELTVAAFLEEGGYERHLRRIRNLYARQCGEIREAIRRHFPEETRINCPSGGFVLWLEMPDGFDADRFAVEAFRQKISLVPGSIFSASGSLKSCLRLSCGFAFGDKAERAIATLGRLAKLQMRSLKI